MLAKEIKIANLKKQREFITAQLKASSEREVDGFPVYQYRGILYKENREYFEKEGIFIYTAEPDEEGIPPKHSFYAEDVDLSPEELQAAEEVEVPPYDASNAEEHPSFRNFMEFLERHSMKLDDEDDDFEDDDEADEEADDSSSETAPSASEE